MRAPSQYRDKWILFRTETVAKEAGSQRVHISGLSSRDS